MTTKQLEQLLRSMKDAPEFGGDYSEQVGDEIWTRVASEIGIDPATKPLTLTWRHYAEYFSWKLSHVWLQPFSIALSAFALVFGGWIATVNASFDSVPGDVLYPVKLVTERMQITLATSGQQRAKLHAEFAGRRLDELNEITSSDRDGKDVRVKAAVEGFKQEIASVNDELVTIQQSDPGQAATLAIIVDEKTDQYQAAIAQSEPTVPEESWDDVEQAKTAVQETNAQAIDTIVGSHETNQQPQTEESLQKNFQEKLGDVQTRMTLSLGRLAVIEAALAQRGSPALELRTQIDAARVSLASHDKDIQEAMDTFAAGGYRKAFELLSSVETQISQSESIITDLEITMTTGV